MPTSSRPRRVRVSRRLANLALAGLTATAVLAGCGDGEEAINDSIPPEITLPPDGGEINDAHLDETPPVSTGAGEACDSIGVHSQMAMWNPSLADEMVDLECPWPWAPELQDLSGGAEDSSIEAAFEPARYADAFAVVDEERFGTCEVRAVAQADATGLVFGFDVGLRAETCADGGRPNVMLSLHEYATRAWRDAAANATPGSMVLGRWTVQVTGDDTASVDRLTAALQAAGAVPVG